jgi:hypothetical protein
LKKGGEKRNLPPNPPLKKGGKKEIDPLPLVSRAFSKSGIKKRKIVIFS